MIQVNSYAETDFKKTEIGYIPVDWDLQPLNQLATVKYGKARPKNEGNVPVVGSSGIFASADMSLIDYSTIVVGRKGSAGQVWLIKQPCWVADTAFYLEWKSEVNVDYLAAYLDLHKLSGEHAKTTMPSLQKPDLENLPIALPSPSEQRRIAAVLNAIQEEIAAQDDIITSTKDFKGSLTYYLFTFGVGERPTETRMSAIGEIPAHWDLRLFGDCVEIVSGQVDPRLSQYQDLVHIGSEHIESKTGRILAKRTAAEQGIRSGNYLFASKHILYSKIRPYLVKVALPYFMGVCSADIYPLFPKQGMLTLEFLFHYLLSDSFTKQAVSHQQRTGIPKINREQLNSTHIPVPPTLEEQAEIATQLSILDQKIAIEEDRKAAIQDFFKTMLHQLMTGQIRLLSDEGLPL